MQILQDMDLGLHITEIPAPRVTLCCNTAAAAAKLLQSCPTLGDPRDDSPPGSPVPGILQARTLEWVAISFSRQGTYMPNEKSHSVEKQRQSKEIFHNL